MIIKKNWENDIEGIPHPKHEGNILRTFKGQNILIQINQLEAPMTQEVDKPTVFDLHPEEQINWLLQGTGVAFQNDESIALDEGDIVLVPSNVPHSFRPTGNKPLLLLNIIAPVPPDRS